MSSTTIVSREIGITVVSGRSLLLNLKLCCEDRRRNGIGANE